MSLVAFLPGNGHVDARLDPARAALAQRGDLAVDLRSVNYGAHGSFNELLDAVRAATVDADLVYATGIGGLVWLALLARGEGVHQPAILQGPVLWGLETRRFPKLMRLPLMPRLLVQMIKTGPIQRRFMRKHFQKPLDPEFQRTFFGGYKDAAAFERWFAWLTPGLLRSLEADLSGQSAQLANVTALWGGDDHVVSVEELRLTEEALGVKIPVKVIPDWGHYPMIDHPEEWVEEVARALASGS